MLEMIRFKSIHLKDLLSLLHVKLSSNEIIELNKVGSL